MSPTFEQNVRDVLTGQYRHGVACAVRLPTAGGDYLRLCDCGRDAQIAHVVAAAIEETLMAERRACTRNGMHPSTRAWHIAALDELRAAPRDATP